jgi:hypothetical protein
MACGAYPDDPLRYFLEWRFMDGSVCTFGDSIGVTVTMLFFFGVTFFTLYQASGSVAVPVGAIIVLAPVAFLLFPAIGVQFAAVVVILSLAMVGTYVYIQVS